MRYADTVTAALIAVAAEWAGMFTTATRDNGAEFVKCTDEASEACRDMVREAHGGMFPDDMRYEMIRNAVTAIAEADEDADRVTVGDAYADEEPSVYHAARYAWLASHLDRAGYVESAAEELGLPEPFNLSDAIGRGWYTEAQEVFSAVCDAVAEEAERRGDEEDGDGDEEDPAGGGPLAEWTAEDLRSEERAAQDGAWRDMVRAEIARREGEALGAAVARGDVPPLPDSRVPTDEPLGSLARQLGDRQ